MTALEAALNRARSGGFVLFPDQAAAMLSEVERLRAVNAQLLAALKEIAGPHSSAGGSQFIARAAIAAVEAGE